MNNIENCFGEIWSTKTDPTFLMALMDELSPFLEYKLFPINTRFTHSVLNSQKCYFIRTGAISLYRQPNDILIELFDAPTLRGVIPPPQGTQSLYVLKVISKAEIAIIERDELFELLTEHRLWELFARHQLAINSMAIERMFKLITPTAYDVVRLQLYELINTSDEVRKSITAESYIRSKTKISRSSIMRILTDLKTDNHIVLERGKLKKINHLPRYFKF